MQRLEWTIFLFEFSAFRKQLAKTRFGTKKTDMQDKGKSNVHYFFKVCCFDQLVQCRSPWILSSLLVLILQDASDDVGRQR